MYPRPPGPPGAPYMMGMQVPAEMGQASFVYRVNTWKIISTLFQIQWNTNIVILNVSQRFALFSLFDDAGNARAWYDDAIALCSIPWHDDANRTYDANAWAAYGRNSAADADARPVGSRWPREQRIFQN
jgi:hypothetical protein